MKFTEQQIQDEIRLMAQERLERKAREQRGRNAANAEVRKQGFPKIYTSYDDNPIAPDGYAPDEEKQSVCRFVRVDDKYDPVDEIKESISIVDPEVDGEWVPDENGNLYYKVSDRRTARTFNESDVAEFSEAEIEAVMREQAIQELRRRRNGNSQRYYDGVMEVPLDDPRWRAAHTSSGPSPAYGSNHSDLLATAVV